MPCPTHTHTYYLRSEPLSVFLSLMGPVSLNLLNLVLKLLGHGFENSFPLAKYSGVNYLLSFVLPAAICLFQQREREIYFNFFSLQKPLI